MRTTLSSQWIRMLFLLGLYPVTILYSCSVDETISVLSTSPVTEITRTTATGGGNITNDGGASVTQRGVCWSTGHNPTTTDSKTTDGAGIGNFSSSIISLTASTIYFVRAYATNSIGTSYGNEVTFTTASSDPTGTQIIADHTIVDKFDKIPENYLDEVKKMLLVIAGESHAGGTRRGFTELKALNSTYDAVEGPSWGIEASTTSHLRVSGCTWGDYDNSSGWVSWYGEEDWWTNATAIARTKGDISYCNNNSLTMSAFGFGWCYDGVWTPHSTNADPIYGVHWFGETQKGPQGILPFGLDAGDQSLTGNSLSLDSYLEATQAYIDYCTSNGITTKVFFSTGPVDNSAGSVGDEALYQGYLKDEHIRAYVKANSSRILFDYADILCYDDKGIETTKTWNGHSFPAITTTNLGSADYGHIGAAGRIRLAKALWWMMARIAGWDGK
jgi:hypothetical protein